MEKTMSNRIKTNERKWYKNKFQNSCIPLFSSPPHWNRYSSNCFPTRVLSVQLWSTGVLRNAEAEVWQILRWVPMNKQTNYWKNDYRVKNIHAPFVFLCIPGPAQWKIHHTIDCTNLEKHHVSKSSQRTRHQRPAHQNQERGNIRNT